MGQRQSQQSDTNNTDNTNTNNNETSSSSSLNENTRGDRVLRPRPRRSATLATPYRLRRERSSDNPRPTLSQPPSRSESFSLPRSSSPSPNETISPFSRMIAQVISEAVVASFRSEQMPMPSQQEQSPSQQQLTMHLSPEIFQQMEPESTEDSFMRFMRLPVIVTSVSRNHQADTTAVNADGQPPSTPDEETEITRVMMLPVFLYGLRTNTSHPPQETPQSESTQETAPRRQSARIRERVEREQQQQQQQQSRGLGTGQWTVYIISGNSVENMMNDSPSYEELLDLATFIGPARRPTVSQEAIDSHVPLLKYTQQVKQTMLGNAEGCQVCLNNYQSEEDVRVLDCHHGFHKECIDKWLTEGQNKCPLCRHQPVPTS